MNKNFVKVISTVLSASMLLSMTSCSLFDKSAEEVTAAADSFCSELVKAKASKVFDLCYDFDEDNEELYTNAFSNTASLDGVEFDEDYTTVFSAIQSTFSYEIDEESVESSAKNKEGKIDATISLVDYESVMSNEDNLKDADTLAAAISDCEDTIDFDVTLEFVKDEDSWLVENYEDIFDDFFAYQDAEFDFSANFIDLIDYTDWYCDDGFDYYENVSMIEFDIWILSEGTSEDWSVLSYDVYYEGTNVYSAPVDAYVSYIECPYYCSASEEYVAAGSYQIDVKDPDGNIIASGTCTVAYLEPQMIEEPTSTSDRITADADIVDMFGWYEGGEALYDATYEACWWAYEDYTVTSDGFWDSSIEPDFEYSIEVDSTLFSDTLYWSLFYSADGSYDSLESVVSYEAVDIHEYGDGTTFYECSYEGISAGVYVIIISDSTGDLVYCCDYIEVI